MTERSTLQQQIDEVECCRLSIKSAVEAWQVAPEKRRGVETGCARSKLEPLQAAVRSLEWLRDHQDIVREVIAARRQADA